MAVTVDITDRFPTLDGSPLGNPGHSRVYINRNTGSFIWEMDVIGTHFPSLSEYNAVYTSIFDLISSEPNNVTINYADGTGDQVYPFIYFGGAYRIRFQRRSDNAIGTTPTPGNISGTNPYDATLHFYEDLPLPSGTVDDFYDHHRKITVTIEKFFSITSFNINRIGIYGTIPSIINRLVSLNTLVISSTLNFTGIDNNFSRVFSRQLNLSRLGFSFGTSIPDFILNSPTLEFVSISNMVNLSGQTPASSKLDLFLNDPSYLPVLNGFNLSRCSIDFQLPNLRQSMTGEMILDVMPSGFQFSPDLSTYQFSFLRMQSGGVGYSEIKRLMEGGSVQSMFLLGLTMGSDFDLSVNNTTLTSLRLGRQDFSGNFPAFLSKLTVLHTLNWGRMTDGNVDNFITNWGTSGISTSITSLFIYHEVSLPPILPTWFSTLVNLTDLTLDGYNTQTRIDDHVDSFYAMASVTTDFDGLNYTLFGSASNNNSTRPSGIYQAGTTSTPMEKIWDLVNNHNMIVTVTNSTGDGQEIFTP